MQTLSDHKALVVHWKLFIFWSLFPSHSGVCTSTCYQWQIINRWGCSHLENIHSSLTNSCLLTLLFTNSLHSISLPPSLSLFFSSSLPLPPFFSLPPSLTLPATMPIFAILLTPAQTHPQFKGNYSNTNWLKIKLFKPGLQRFCTKWQLCSENWMRTLILSIGVHASLCDQLLSIYNLNKCSRKTWHID